MTDLFPLRRCRGQASTVPFWSDPPTTEQWLEGARRLASPIRASLVICSYHLPVRETLCTYCACNTVITRVTAARGYVDLLRREWGNTRRPAPAAFETSAASAASGRRRASRFFSPRICGGS